MAIKWLDAKRLQGTNAERLALTTGATDTMGSAGDAVSNDSTLDEDNEKLGTGCLNFESSSVTAGQTIDADKILDAMTTKGTVAFWFYNDASQERILWSAMNSGAATGLELKVRTDEKLGLNVSVGGSPQYEIASDTVFTYETWYHVAITHDGTTVKLYQNGAKVAESTNSTWISGMTGVNGSNIGARSIRNSVALREFFDGKIDDFGVWSEALVIGTDEDTADSIKWLFNTGTGRLCSTIPTNLKIYYNCDSATVDNNAVEVYPSLPNGTIFNETDAYKYFMFDGTDTWNQMVSS